MAQRIRYELLSIGVLEIFMAFISIFISSKFGVVQIISLCVSVLFSIILILGVIKVFQSSFIDFKFSTLKKNCFQQNYY